MKYFFRILLVLVLSAAVVFGMYYYTNGNPFEQESGVKLTTVSQQPATEKNANRELLAALKKEDYYLYKSTKGVILTHGKKDYEFDNWSRLIDLEKPQMTLADCDGDGVRELLIKAVSSKNESSGEVLYDIYLLKPEGDEDSPKSYNVFCANQTTWADILNTQIREEVGQLKSCKKIIQVSMNAKSKTISYDSETGIAKNGFNGYARALQKDSDYLTFNNWTKGKGVYTINKNNEICISVEVNVTYKETEETQTIGYIKFKLDFKDDNFFVKSKTMNFSAKKEYKVSDPHTASATAWSYTENNSNESTKSTEKTIDWIRYSPDFKADVIEQTISYSKESTDIKDISKITLTNSYVELTAKPGFNFDSYVQRGGEYSVIINKGGKNEYDIAYTAQIMQIDGAEVLRISFDKSYPKNEINSIEINYGTK